MNDEPVDAVSVTLAPAQNVVAPLAVTVGVVVALTLTVARPLLVQPALLTDTPSCTAAVAAAAVNVIDAVPWPAVIVPFVIVQL